MAQPAMPCSTVISVPITPAAPARLANASTKLDSVAVVSSAVWQPFSTISGLRDGLCGLGHRPSRRQFATVTGSSMLAPNRTARIRLMGAAALEVLIFAYWFNPFPRFGPFHSG